MADNPERLRVHVEARALATEVYKASVLLGNRWKDVDQICGAASSIPSNLGEFCALSHPNEKRRKLETCIGECNELEDRMSILRDAGILEQALCNDLIGKTIKIRKMLFCLYKSFGNFA